MGLPISKECEFMIQYLRDSGVGFSYPSMGQINEGTHNNGSYHYQRGTGGKGLAIDFVGSDLRAIYDVFDHVYTNLAEGILDKHGLTQNILGTRGQPNTGRHVSIYDRADNADTHVHIAVERGVLLEWNGGHPVANAADTFVDFMAGADPKSYYTIYADGGVFTHGDAAFYGSDGATKLLHPIKGGEMTPTKKGYWLFDTVGNVYAHGDAKWYGNKKEKG